MMHRALHRLTPLALLMIVGAAESAESTLAKRLAEKDGWVVYSVPMAADAGAPCCYEFHGKRATRTGCDLDGKSWGINVLGEMPGQPASDSLDVYLRVEHGRVDRVRALAASCPVPGADAMRRLDGVEPGDSIAVLAGLAMAPKGAADDIDADLAAIAFHAAPAATPALAALSTESRPHELRMKALFWLAQARGAEGAQIVERAATTDPDPELRADAVFDLSEAHGIDAYAAIKRIAQTDPSGHVREQALFWMAQMKDPRAENDILAAIGREQSDSAREQAVFALSQLEGERADAALIGLVRGQYPHKVKEQALFWLGQSGSEKALAFLDEVLAEPKH